MVSLTHHQILYEWYRRIRRILSESFLGVGNGQPDMPLNINGWYHWIRRILPEYLLGVGNGQPDTPIKYYMMVPSD